MYSTIDKHNPWKTAVLYYKILLRPVNLNLERKYKNPR